MSQRRKRYARFLQMAPPPPEPEVEMPKGPRGHVRLQFPAFVMDLWERGSGGSGTHHGHHEGHHGEAQVQHVGNHQMTHLEHHHGHDDSMSDLGLALISSGTTIFLAMISPAVHAAIRSWRRIDEKLGRGAIFAMRLFREMLRPQATGAPAAGGDMQGVLQLEIPGVQPFRPFSGQGHRLVEVDKDEASGGAAASGER